MRRMDAIEYWLRVNQVNLPVDPLTRINSYHPRPEVGLDRQTTEVTLSEVHLRDIASPLWLPKVVNIDIRFYGLKFRNEHHYANYRQYRVSSKMIFPH